MNYQQARGRGGYVNGRNLLSLTCPFHFVTRVKHVAFTSKLLCSCPRVEVEHIAINQRHVRVQQPREPFSEHQQVRGGSVPEDNLVTAAWKS